MIKMYTGIYAGTATLDYFNLFARDLLIGTGGARVLLL
jgi:hypothetical protein